MLADSLRRGWLLEPELLIHVVAGLGMVQCGRHQVHSRGGPIEYELHDPVIAEYLQLLSSEPAYIDDVAIVTPVDRSFRESMYRTRGDRPDDFPARVESSISFLRRDRATRKTDSATLDQASAWRRRSRPRSVRHFTGKSPAALPAGGRWHVEHRQRPIGLRNSGYLKTVDATWWNRPLSDPVLAEAEGAFRYAGRRSDEKTFTRG